MNAASIASMIAGSLGRLLSGTSPSLHRHDVMTGLVTLSPIPAPRSPAVRLSRRSDRAEPGQA